MSAARRNVELKALDRDPAATRAAALAAGAEPVGILRQRDTYFAVTHGRLKLREQDDGATLIAYARADTADARASDYHLIPIADPDAALAALAATHDVHAVVDKTRELLLKGCVRIHLDTVAGLEPHVELEGVIGDDADEARAAAEVAELRAALGIDDAAIATGSYCDLLLAAAAIPGERARP